MQTPNAAPSLLRLREVAIATTLANSYIFSGLSGEDTAVIAAICQIRALKKGEALFCEGDKAEGLYIIQTGQISIHRITPDGRKQIIHVFGPRESFAEAVLATKEAYPANATALKSSQVILVPKAPLLALVTRSPQLALRILASMGMHLRMLVQNLQDMKGRQIESRLAAWLLQQPSDKAPGGEGEIVILQISKKMLAGQLGVTGETLSRTFARMRETGVANVSKNRIHIPVRDGLEKLAKIEAQG